MSNPDGKLWYQHKVRGLCSDRETLSAAHALNLISTISSFNDRFINQQFPILGSSANAVFLQTRPNIGFQDLLKAALRLRPDKIYLGEYRGADMLTLLKCWNTSIPLGIANLHANYAKAERTI